LQEHKNDQLIVHYDANICIHARNCVKNLPAVFNALRKPWIDVNGVDVEAIKRTIGLCPSGALSFEMMQGQNGARGIRAPLPATRIPLPLVENGEILQPLHTRFREELEDEAIELLGLLEVDGMARPRHLRQTCMRNIALKHFDRGGRCDDIMLAYDQ
jgi:uncharacterized Fe-S cluster protein YjdI